AARALVQGANDASRARHARHLAHHRRQIERVVQRRNAEPRVEDFAYEGQMLRVGVYSRKASVEGTTPEADALVRERVAADVLTATRQEMGCRPALCRADFEHAHTRRDVAVERDGERVRVREPEVARELRVDPWEHPVDLVVGLVPALRPRLREPPFDLALLLARAGEIVVQQQRDIAVQVEGAAAGFADERSVLLVQSAATDRAT